MVFKPNGNSFKASPRICLCDDCSSDYGSCSSFKEYPLICHQLKLVFLRSAVEAVVALKMNRMTMRSVLVILSKISLSQIPSQLLQHHTLLSTLSGSSKLKIPAALLQTVMIMEMFLLRGPATLQDTFWKKFQKLKTNISAHFKNRLLPQRKHFVFLCSVYRIKEGLSFRKSSLHGNITVYRTKQFFTPLTFYGKLLLLILYVG